MHVIVESIFYGWAVAQTPTVDSLHSLTQDVGTRVPKHLFSCYIKTQHSRNCHLFLGKDIKHSSIFNTIQTPSNFFLVVQTWDSRHTLNTMSLIVTVNPYFSPFYAWKLNNQLPNNHDCSNEHSTCTDKSIAINNLQDRDICKENFFDSKVSYMMLA